MEVHLSSAEKIEYIESYREYKDNYPKSTVSLSDYMRLCKQAQTDHEARFAGREIHAIGTAKSAVA